MCEMLGTEPKEEEIPVEPEDLTLDSQFVLFLYQKLQARWDGGSGQYLGKDLTILPMLFDQYKVDRPTRSYVLEIIPILDNLVSKDVAQKIKQKVKVKGTTPHG